MASNGCSSAPYSCFRLEKKDGIAEVILCRGDKLNSIIPEFWGEIGLLLFFFYLFFVPSLRLFLSSTRVPAD